MAGNRDRDPFIYEISEKIHYLGPARPNLIFHSGLDLLFGLRGLMRIQIFEPDPISKFIPE